jgi:hypothetical protein
MLGSVPTVVSARNGEPSCVEERAHCLFREHTLAR